MQDKRKRYRLDDLLAEIPDGMPRDEAWEAMGEVGAEVFDDTGRRLSARARIEGFLAETDEAVFVRADFAAFGSRAAVGRVLLALLREGVLVRVGVGTYVRATISTLTGRPV
ncbi:hypothetical protein EHS17_13950 [Rhodobacteraceae bacterium CH30]|nr:hypothetical protein EHS17_13950 [Rhodobacteraceae bacterium CH30]